MRAFKLLAFAAIGLSTYVAFSGFAESSRWRSENTFFQMSVLGQLAPDDDDPTVMLRMWGHEGLLIRAHSIRVSHDEGHNWELAGRVSATQGPKSFQEVWIRNDRGIYALVDGSVLESSSQGREWKETGKIARTIGNFTGINGDNDESWMVSVGQRSVRIPKESLSSLPKYANDVASTSKDPRMLIPAIAISDENGKVWRPARVPKEIGPLYQVIVSGVSAVALGPYAILTTNDKGQSWSSPKLVGLENREESYPVSATIVGQQVWISLKNGVLLMGDISKHELFILSNSVGPLEDLRFADSCAGFALRAGNVVGTTDGGTTWSELAHSGNAVALCLWGSDAAAMATHSQVVRVSPEQGNRNTSCHM
jgi:photosystem II stability/assembly factor-like uncharacterized protein